MLDLFKVDAGPYMSYFVGAFFFIVLIAWVLNTLVEVLHFQQQQNQVQVCASPHCEITSRQYQLKGDYSKKCPHCGEWVLPSEQELPYYAFAPKLGFREAFHLWQGERRSKRARYKYRAELAKEREQYEREQYAKLEEQKRLIAQLTEQEDYHDPI